ncbi:sensor histidine kinase [Anaerosporobacter sp.]
MKKTTKKYSQIVYLFWIYAGAIIFVLGAFFVVIDAVYKSNIYTDAKNQTTTFCTSIQSAVASELNKMSSIAMNVVYSDIIRDTLGKSQEVDDKGSISNKDSSIPMLQIHDALNAAQQNTQSASQVNVYTLNEVCIGTGFIDAMSNVQLKEKGWYDAALSLDGKKFFTVPEKITFNEFTNKNMEDHMYISLVRLFHNRKGKKAGFVEVVQDCNQIFSLVDQLQEQNPQTSIFIFNDRGETVYPYDKSGVVNPGYYSLIKDNNMEPLVSKWIHTDYYIKSLATYQVIDSYNWSILVYENRQSIYYPLHKYRVVFFTAGFITVLLVILLCFWLSRKITRPLKEIKDATRQITITSVLDEEHEHINEIDSNITEIHQLCDAIRMMYEQLKDSSREVLLSRAEETRAKLSATQSLVNPHFLYNCLTHMSIMAEEEMNDEIVQLCNSLCDFFRYITSTKEMKVPLKEELVCIEKYIDCMKIRYGEDLTYICNISDSVKDVLIPKLILQPIVENAFKHGFNKKPPWVLKISAYKRRKNWRIEIEDNGGMLTDEQKEVLLKEFRETKKNAFYNMEIGGMGLKNTYLRMKLLYGEKAMFTIVNHYPGRTKFILGGPIEATKEKSVL